MRYISDPRDIARLLVPRLASSETRTMATPLRKARCEAELLMLGRDELARLDSDTEDLFSHLILLPSLRLATSVDFAP